MNDSIIITTPDLTAALEYLWQHLNDNPLITLLGSEFLVHQCRSVTTVTTMEPRSRVDFSKAIGGTMEPCYKWFDQRALSFLEKTADGVVLFGDFVSSPIDPVLETRKHPPFWQYENRLFWPVVSMEASQTHVREAQAWAAAMREMACFCRAPDHLRSNFVTRNLTVEEFRTMAFSVTSIVTDVFDGEGYMEWRRQ
jgi:hypothetical protein